MTERVLHRALRVPVGASAGTLVVQGEQAHHLGRVARARVGDPVVVFDGEGLECDATITAFARDSVTLTGEGVREGVRAHPAEMTLIQGFPKGDKLEQVVRQATELGVRAVWAVYTERSVPQSRADRAGARRERLLRVAEEAARQCGRADVPEVLEGVELSAAMQRAGEEGRFALRLTAWERSTAALASRVKPNARGPVAVLIGPEGGLSEQEVLVAQNAGFLDISLGPRILRTETAAVATLAMLAMLCGGRDE